jgi:hypothetical protein
LGPSTIQEIEVALAMILGLESAAGSR